MDLIRLRDVDLGYDGKIIIKNVHLTIESGDFVAVVGENGSGKSTLIKGILGLIPVKKGSIEFPQKNRIGYMPQESKIQRDFPSTVEEVILSGNLQKNGFLYSMNERKEAFKIAENLGIDALMKRPFAELSLGQRQRVLLARAICASDQLLILDEPTNAMDEESRRIFYQELEERNQKGTTIIVITHHLEEIKDMVKQVIHIDGGIQYMGSYESYQRK